MTLALEPESPLCCYEVGTVTPASHTPVRNSVLLCCFKAGLHQVMLSARRTKPRLRGSCRVSLWERSRDPGPGPEGLPEYSHPVWSLQEEGQGPCFLPPPGEAMVTLLSAGVTVTYIPGGWDTTLTHSWEGEQRETRTLTRWRVGGLEQTRQQGPRLCAARVTCRSHLYHP